MEALNRMAISQDRQDDPEFANACINFIQFALETFANDTDVVVLTLRLVAEIMPALVLFKLQILHVLLNCVQLYAPPAHPVRPRVIKRLSEKELAKLEKELFVKREKDRLIAEEIARQIELERIRILEEEARKAAELEEQRRIEVGSRLYDEFTFGFYICYFVLMMDVLGFQKQ